MVPVSIEGVSRSKANVNVDSLRVLHISVRLGEEGVVSVRRNSSEQQDSVDSNSDNGVRVWKSLVWHCGGIQGPVAQSNSKLSWKQTQSICTRKVC